MNRNITEAYSMSLASDRQSEFFHRYILGVYALLERLTQDYPDVLIEGCSGGGDVLMLGCCIIHYKFGQVIIQMPTSG